MVSTLVTEIVDARYSYIVLRRDREYLTTGQSLGRGILIAVRELAVAPQLTLSSKPAGPDNVPSC